MYYDRFNLEDKGAVFFETQESVLTAVRHQCPARQTGSSIRHVIECLEREREVASAVGLKTEYYRLC